MSASSRLVARLRRALRTARRHAGSPWTATSRFYRALHYAFGLLVWSRISGGRRRLAGIELPMQLLAKKHIRVPPPRLEVSDGRAGQAFSTGFAEVYALLFANLQKAGILSRFRHALPGPAFRGVYLWDSAFIAQIWKCWEPEVAAETLHSVVDLRDGRRLQHVVSEFAQSDLTQPPLVAWSALEIGEWMPPDRRKRFFAAIYPALCDYHAWLCDNRQLSNGLFFWRHPYESGVENAPRFGTRDERSYRDTQRSAAPDLCTYVVLQLEALAAIATTLGRARDIATFATKANALRQKMERILWHEDDGVYYDRESETDTFIRSRTIASLLPLWAGIPSPERARRLRDAVVNPDDFGTLLPLPSVSRLDQAFEKDMWRGPVWINTAYGVIQGLLRYGFEREAGALAYRLCEGVYRVFTEERRIYEFYDPDNFHTRHLHRKRGNRWKALTLGSGPQRDFVGWSGLVNTLVVEVLFGLSFDPGSVSLGPRFPETAVGTFNLHLPSKGLDATLHLATGGEVSGNLNYGGLNSSFSMARGETFTLASSTEP